MPDIPDINNSHLKEKKESPIEKEGGEVLPEKEEKIVAGGERRGEVAPEPTEKEIQELRQKIEESEMAEGIKAEAMKRAEQLKTLKEKEKIGALLEIAEKKGVIFAVNVAKKMNDAYVLDTLHDILAKDEYYKKFIK